MSWSWEPERVTIDRSGVGDKASYGFVSPTADDLRAVATNLGEIRDIYAALHSAWTAFAAGMVDDYRDAIERMRHLRREKARALFESIEKAREIFMFFEPELAGEFKGREDLLIEFAMDALVRLATYVETREDEPESEPVPDSETDTETPTPEPGD